jgi:hypothetical protein
MKKPIWGMPDISNQPAMLRVLFSICFAAAMAIYVVMILWSLPVITEAAGGLAPFDMRPLGYSLAEAQTFLAAIDPETVKFYRNVQLTLDIFYPALITISLVLGIYLLLPARFGVWRWVIAALPLPIAPFDYLENNLIGMMLTSGPDMLSADLVSTASRWTLLKSSFTTASMLILVALSLWWLVRRIQRRA